MRTRLRQPDKVRFASKEANPEKYLADFYSYPDYFVRYCLSEYGLVDTERLLEHYNRPPTATYRVNLLKAKTGEITKILDDNEVEWSAGRYLPEFLNNFMVLLLQKVFFGRHDTL